MIKSEGNSENFGGCWFIFLRFLRHDGKEALVEMGNITDMGKRISMASALTELYRWIEHQCMATLRV